MADRAQPPGSTRPIRKPPLRMAFLYVPNGVHMPGLDTAVPKAAEFDLPPILEPLRTVKDELLVLSGLTLESSAVRSATAVATTLAPWPAS